jgi:hypothetical protein
MKMKATIRYLLLAFIGIIIIIFIIYNRLHLRVPRELPLILTENNILIYAYIYCNILIIFLLNIYNYKKNSSTNDFIKKLNHFYDEIIFTVFDFLDTFIWFWYKTRLTLLSKKFFYKAFKNYNNQYKKLYIYVNIIPRFITIFFFCLDILYFQKLHYFYLALISLLIPLLFNIGMYCLLQYFTEALKGIENDIIIYIENYYAYGDIMLPVNIINFFEQLCLSKLNLQNDLKYQLIFSPSFRKEYAVKFNLTYVNNIDFSKYYEAYRQLFNDLTNYGCLYFGYHAFKKKYSLLMNISIYFIYLCGWLYLFYFGIYVLPTDYFNFLLETISKKDPFSDIEIL